MTRMRMPPRVGLCALACALALLLAAAAPAAALQIFGSLNFAGNPTNYFDPANGFVPTGCENTAGTTVTLSNTAVEFCYQDSANTDTADFSAMVNTDTLTVTDVVGTSGAAPWQMQFTAQTPGAWTSLNKISDTFPGGVTGTLVGDIITLTWGGVTPGTPATYTVVFTMATPGAVGDPQFTGLRGQSYQVHGVAGSVYNLVSDSDLQYNSRFVFLDQGECPVIAGRVQKGNCWSHSGSYLGELGFKTRAGDRIRTLAGSARQGFAAVEFNGKPLQVEDTVVLARDMGALSFNDTHTVQLSIGSWSFVLSNSDSFINQRVSVDETMLRSNSLRSHGILGQTHTSKVYPTPIRYIAGAVDDYLIRGEDDSVFGDDFLYNKFN